MGDSAEKQQRRDVLSVHSHSEMQASRGAVPLLESSDLLAALNSITCPKAGVHRFETQQSAVRESQGNQFSVHHSPAEPDRRVFRSEDKRRGVCGEVEPAMAAAVRGCRSQIRPDYSVRALQRPAPQASGFKCRISDAARGQQQRNPDENRGCRAQVESAHEKIVPLLKSIDCKTGPIRHPIESGPTGEEPNAMMDVAFRFGGLTTRVSGANRRTSFHSVPAGSGGGVPDTRFCSNRCKKELRSCLAV